MHAPIPPALQPNAQHVARAMRLANAAVVSDIESNCPALRSACGTITWYDTRPMLDQREHSPEVIDMASEAIEYGVESGLLIRHEQHPYWLRVARPGR